MKKYFAQLRPLERRLAVGVLVILILVLNYVFIWPHFSDWGNLQNRLAAARRDLARDRAVLVDTPNIEKQLKNLESQGEFVSPEDQGNNFMRLIQSQSQQSGVSVGSTSRQLTHTNEFFIEQVQNIIVTATDEQLVDFLYKLGSGSSMIRVRDLELQPDGPHTHLNASLRLVASYQKNPAPAGAPANSSPKPNP